MPEPLLYLKAMVAAVVVSAMAVLAMAGVRRPASTSRMNSACVLGMGLGLAIGYYVLFSRFAWPPANGLDRFLTIVVPAALAIELIAGSQRVPRWAVWLMRLSLAATIPRILLHGSVYLSGADGEWTLWQAGTALAVCGALLAGSWGLLSRLSQRSPGVSIPLALGLSILCAGLTVMMAGYIKGGAAAFPLAATLLATAIAAKFFARRFGEPANFGAPAIVGIGIVGLFGLLFIGRFFGRLSTSDSLAMLLAPLLCWATEIPLLQHRKPWLVGSIRLVLVAIPLLVVLAVAKFDFQRDMAPLLGKVPESTLRLHREGGTEVAISFRLCLKTDYRVAGGRRKAAPSRVFWGLAALDRQPPFAFDCFQTKPIFLPTEVTDDWFFRLVILRCPSYDSFMNQQRIFLTAQWRYLIMLNYAVDPAVLAPHVPRGTELDFYDGQTFVSVVGFLFQRTKLLGVPIPAHRSFEEVNLRFYIRRQTPTGIRRGVVFIKEIAPRWAVSTVARLCYNESYVCLPMRHRVELNGQANGDGGRVEYAWRYADRWNRVAVTACGSPRPLTEGSQEEFIAEHYWGYSIQRDGGTKEYEVQHPRWHIWQTRDATFDCAVDRLYGPQFEKTLAGPADSAFLADGSAVTVRRGVRI